MEKHDSRKRGKSIPRKPKGKRAAKKRARKPGDGRRGPLKYLPSDNDRVMVVALVAEEVPYDVMASLVSSGKGDGKKGIGIDTFKRAFASELAGGSAMILTASYARLLVDIKTPSNAGTRAAIFLAERHGKRIEKAAAKATGKFTIGGTGEGGIPLNAEGEIEISLDIGEARPRDDIVGDSEDE